MQEWGMFITRPQAGEEGLPARRCTFLSNYFKSEKEKEDITKEAAMNIVQEAAMRSVWFMISEKYGKFSLILFYDNEYNNAHGEDL